MSNIESKERVILAIVSFCIAVILSIIANNK